MNSSTPPGIHSHRPASGMQKEYGGSQNSALKGASLAFGVPRSVPKPMTDTYSGTNGAVAAAFVAGMGRRRAGIDDYSHERYIGAPVVQENSIRGNRVASSINRTTLGSTENLKLPRGQSTSRQQSPSHIAATIAAARSTSTSVVQDRQLSSLPRSTSSHSPPKLPSNKSSPRSTGTLVQFFETIHQATPSIDSREIAHHTKPSLSDVTPKSIRLAMEVRLSSQKAESLSVDEIGTNLHPSLSKDDTTLLEVGLARPQAINSSATSSIAYERLPEMSTSRRSARPLTAKTITATNAEIAKPYANDDSSDTSYTSAHDSLTESSLPTSSRKESIIHPPKKPLPNIPTPIQPTPLPTASTRSRDSLALGSVPKARTVSGRLIPQLPTDSLADAIVASSLATSRASSPSKTASPPVPRRQSKQYSLLHQNHAHQPNVSRTPSPAKALRHTMRGPPRSNEDDERVKKNRLLNKHPNKHNEGDRKRWRDQITERERKRYEGVWAANRGHLISDSERPDDVHNLIVRDIWSRSRLSSSVLAEVWNLVGNQGVGRLSREEFVVGMWLVDQCLKGRKLPVKVSESVWSSVTRLSGITISSHGR